MNLMQNFFLQKHFFLSTMVLPWDPVLLNFENTLIVPKFRFLLKWYSICDIVTLWQTKIGYLYKFDDVLNSHSGSIKFSITFDGSQVPFYDGSSSIY